ncbi:BREX-2 system adenine-specific DNA-methyltransferase PglX [Propioniciclava sp. MC1683]|uniref:BREX-2 system adenine-specific DNA-methyltransferase PglX n=1 Tax=Propioniciclava sp. MC1683 TaxID=2760309 RepID=UPI0016027F55|nr:BREX-2 system adenine-specific DNA-methyltransferase PglX [Propioniciclava sp. MC1683]MBB1502069.1 BREX-2 system adenine-specific DNA-methyltransferase PglX [Propioniciclava sp. MC1683]
MTISDTLVADLKQQVLALEADLRERIELHEFAGPWKQEHDAATRGDRTAATYTAWADDRITQAAVSWVLTSVFVRFCEDNRLLSPVWISGPPERRQEALDAQLAYFRAHPEHTDREWLEQAFQHLAKTPATAALVDRQAMLHTVSPSGQAVTRLLEFWRRRDESGGLVHDFTEPYLDTRFLGDLYQDLSDHAKKTYALLQTPEFVEEFILDRTLEPALNDRPLEGFKMIDPACGSGHFLLGAFQRLLKRWDAEAPALGRRERVQKALDAVWGVDLNPFAVAIAIFRLTVAALQAVGERSLERGLGFSINVLAGDSLWFSHEQDALFTTKDDFAYSTENKDALVRALTRGQYDAVVANPPYVNVSDARLRAAYRQRYVHARGRYALTVPFMELLFKLARQHRSSRPRGWVGQITSNSFMKREFGKSIIEDFLNHQELLEVIDSEGAWIPGHNMDGTPTCILVGLPGTPESFTVRSILSKGLREARENTNPESPGYWTSIREGLDAPGFENKWINTLDLPREFFSKHPWTLSGGGVLDVLSAIESSGSSRLAQHAYRIGVFGMTIADEAMIVASSSPKRHSLEPSATASMVAGDDVRDYRIGAGEPVWFPYTPSHSLLPVEDFPAWEAVLWRTRTALWNRPTFSGKSYRESGRQYHQWHQLPQDLDAHPWSIAFAEVATHNHFALDRDGRVFNRSAPVIKLPAEATEDDHLELLSILNSSVSAFWLKQKCKPKGGASAIAWLRTYQFNCTVVGDLPIPKHMPGATARRLDRLTQERSALEASAVAASAIPTGKLLRATRESQDSLRARMVAQQEELDWAVYSSFGLIDEALTYAGQPPEVQLGERAFEIVLARKLAEGDEDTAWFERQDSRPITDIPGDWPADYRDLVQRRIDAIESDAVIRLLESPEFKRRWASEPFEKQAERALRGWLLDRLEDRSLWFSTQGHPTPQSVSQLADRLSRDAGFVSVVELWRKRRDVDLPQALTDLLDAEAVPYLAALRLKDSGLRKFAEWQRIWALQRREDAGETVTIPVPPQYASADSRKTSYWSARGKLDVPKERFIAYPGAGRETDPTPLLGWAGWDHAQQSLALATIIATRQGEGASDEVLTPLVAGMAELQPWVDQWHADIDPAFGVSPAAFTEEQLRAHSQELGLTRDDLAAWRPAAPTRGRKAKG